MDAHSAIWIALFRAIGAASHKKMSMAQLRAAAMASGFGQVRTLLATGNLIFHSIESQAEIRDRLEAIVAAHDLNNEVFLRRPEELEAALVANPFAEAARLRPNHLLVVFHDQVVDKEAVALLEGHRGPERLAANGRELYVDYIKGVGTSKLTANFIARQLGQPGTARNWNTVQKLIAAAKEAGEG